MKITFTLPNKKAETIETTPIGFEVTQMGVRFFDKSLGSPRMKTFDKILAFVVHCDISKELTELSSSLQYSKSDGRLRKGK